MKNTKNHTSIKIGIHIIGLLLTAISLAYWYFFFSTPTTTASANATVAIFNSDNNSQKIARWLGPGDLQFDIDLLGIIHHTEKAIALLRVNQLVPQAYVVGDRLSDELVLSHIKRTGITLEHQQKKYTLPLKALPAVNTETLRVILKNEQNS